MIPQQQRSLTEMRDNPRQRQRRKYANEPTIVDGIKFDSRAEANRWVELRWLEDEKRITGLRRQVPFELIPAQTTPDGLKVRPLVYIADFTFMREGRLVVEDPKGCSTPEWNLKRKLMLWRHGVWVVEVRS